MKTLIERDLAVFWHPCSQMRDFQEFPPLEVVAAQGARLTLADGRQVLDAISSWWCKSLGHGHAGVRARIEQQLGRFEHVIAANTTHTALVELCERLLDMANHAAGTPPALGVATRATGDPGRGPVGGHFGKVFFAENGSTAVEIALKMALQAQAQRGQSRRIRFAALAGGYHGETVATLAVGDLGLYAEPYRSLMFPVHKVAPIPYRSGPDDPAWQDAQPEWGEVERSLEPLADTLAAIVYEPVLQAAGGMRLYSPDLLRRLRRFADARGIYLIADEIAAGMGRLGTMLASQLAVLPDFGAPGATWEGTGATSEGTGEGTGPTSGGAGPGGKEQPAGVLPDFAVFSKGLTAGFLPLSAVLTTNEIFGHFDGDWGTGRAFLHSNTHTGNALAIAAALGALDAYAAEDVLGLVASNGPRLREALSDLARRSPVLTGVRGAGMVAAVDLCAADGRRLDPAARTGRRVFREAVARGALLRPLGDTLYLFPPLNCPVGDLVEMVDILEQSVAAAIPP